MNHASFHSLFAASREQERVLCDTGVRCKDQRGSASIGLSLESSVRGSSLSDRGVLTDYGFSPQSSLCHTMSSMRQLPVRRVGITVTSSEACALQKLWVVLCTNAAGTMDMNEVANLLRIMSVEMDHCTEIEFYHTADPAHCGQIAYDSFTTTFDSFKRTRKFKGWAPAVQVSCAVAVHNGLVLDNVVTAWRRIDLLGEEALGMQGLSRVLKEIGVGHTEEDVMEVMTMRGDDGKVELQVFLEMFAESMKDDSTLKFEQWMSELRNVVAARARMEETLKSPEQEEQEKYERLRAWYERVFLWILFIYAQANVALPIFDLCFHDPFLNFEGTTTWLALLLLVSDVVIWAQLLLGFRLPKDINGAPVYKPQSVQALHLRSPQLYRDLFIALPLELLVGIGYPTAVLHPLFRLNKLLLLYYIHATFRSLFADLFGPRWWRIVNALYWWAVLGHLVACVFNAIALSAGDEDTQVVLTVADYSHLSTLHKYLQSLSYAVNTMAGLSRGVFPRDDTLALFALFVVILGVFVYALLLAVVALALQMRDYEGRFNSYIEEVRNVFFDDVRAGRLPASFLQDTIRYHRHVFRSTGQFHIEEDVLLDLPKPLRVSVDLVTGRDTVGKVDILADAAGDDEFVYALQQCLHLAVFPPDADIVEAGTEGHEMYFIRCGTCDVISKGNVVGQLGAGHMFGEVALVTDVARTATVRTTSFCNVLVLTAEDFRLVASSFPHLVKIIEIHAQDRIKGMMVEEDKVSFHTHLSESLSSFAPNLRADDTWMPSASHRTNPLEKKASFDTWSFCEQPRPLSISKAPDGSPMKKPSSPGMSFTAIDNPVSPARVVTSPDPADWGSGEQAVVQSPNPRAAPHRYAGQLR
eukprot:TRINITY_DN6441_c0_g1_i7.p1 TRINITY_DN6441_c0_g1~~TRINITY_DN6441_c0_g1_i7.p1  ORF type:complete len:867 (+),score=233.37 TRINITY_DN6441_c0_g1_i7:49-2649(+)